MKSILIITTYFPPDTAIASVRPYMFAKYLTKMGHSVTVLRSGIITNKPSEANPIEGLGIDVFSYLGEDSAAERYARGEDVTVPVSKSRASFLPEGLRKPAAKLFHMLNSSKEFSDRFKRAEGRFEKQKVALDRLKAEGYTFDVVFSTFGELENVYAGEYANTLFNCPYILDFRDLMAQRSIFSRREYDILRRIQRESVLKADMCTVVSEHSADDLRAYIPEKEIITLYNGYEPIETAVDELPPADSGLSFCYTGALYSGKRDASALFRAISELEKCHEISRENIRFLYAGRDCEQLKAQALMYGVEDIITDMGYVTGKDLYGLQRESDVFVVLSWNTKAEHGILTGKFYEGIRCRRPVLSIISGDEKNSELRLMNDTYHYGFCYEEANDGEDYEELKEWLLSAYRLKQQGKSLPYTASEAFSSDFRYDILTQKLEKIINDICEK